MSQAEKWDAEEPKRNDTVKGLCVHCDHPIPTTPIFLLMIAAAMNDGDELRLLRVLDDGAESCDRCWRESVEVALVGTRGKADPELVRRLSGRGWN